MLSRGLTFSKHSAVIAALNREFVRTGELDRRHLEALQAAFDERNTADYGFEESYPAETARTTIERAEIFVRDVSARLGV